jgi:hypothetical protein
MSSLEVVSNQRDRQCDQQAQALVARLWPHGDSESTAQIYVILDGARDHRIADFVRFSNLQYACMYSGKLSPALQQAAPYIVHLSPKAELTRTLLQQAWGQSWGILIETGPDISMEQLRRHFRGLQRVSTEDGTSLVFRFYDPRVLRVYLPTCTLSELGQFFGPVTKIVVEDMEGEGMVEYRKIAQGIDIGVRNFMSNTQNRHADRQNNDLSKI